MNDFKWTWRGLSLLSIAATLLLITGFIYAAQDIMYPRGASYSADVPQPTAAPAEETGELKVAAVGDSLAKGTGDNTGEGFVRRAVAGLSAGGTRTELVGNLGINGLTTAGLRDKLKEEGVQYVLRQANIILVSIGGNDLFRGAQSMLNEAEGAAAAGQDAAEGSADSRIGTGASGRSDDSASGGAPAPGDGSTGNAALKDLTPEQLLADLPGASKRLEAILTAISEINPEARIYYIGLYNPFGDLREMLIPGNQAVTSWNAAAMDIINRNTRMTLVPTLDLFNGHLDKYLSSDHFHPNSDGYQRMADRIVQAVR
ncbi:lysophospholipase L1-like esterase [Paenibacillus forsythiae]|uniref:Lysophospholipase L1-like esterase n=1 Tax=Paenibacillus forsythiae TaxID=365616 RepID=A0ABU3H7E3_9BACL|nr:GDSL-type esterase/lipase family protein [Paenibacillus forsythiae]MDT3426745.1 lysophospholipase L1-like esterase [Paenibacillus forsythiae]